MSDDDGQQNSTRSGRLKWTDAMNRDLIKCKYKAKEMTESNNPPLKADGKQKGYMQVMKELWDEMGYAGLNISKQNLRNQAAYVEKSLGDVSEVIRNNVGRRGIEEQESDETDSGRENQFISGSEIIYSQCGFAYVY